ncbi:MAG: periplasmic heavy metal sensor [Paracoccaceae bacterium]
MADLQGTDRTPRRWVRWLLVASLAVNLLVLGTAAGLGVALLRGNGPAAGAHDAAWPYVAALAREDRRAMGRAIRAEMVAQGFTRAERRARYEEAVGLLRAEPFDGDAFSDLLARQFAASARLQTAGRDALATRLEQMSPADREAYAARLEEALARGGRHRGGDRGEGRKPQAPD